MAKRLLLISLALALSGGLYIAYLLALPREAPAALRDLLVPEPRPVQPFTLTDQDGKRFSRDDLNGRWTILFFGYTHCPDVCPTALTLFHSVIGRLAADPQLLNDTRFVFVSVDPHRDPPSHLKEYLAYFDPKLTGLTGEKGEIDKLAADVGAVYLFEGDTSGDDYIVNHSATLFLVNPEGEIYARLMPPHRAEEVARQLASIRDYHNH